MPLKFQRVKRAGLRYRDKRHLEADSKPGVRGRVSARRTAFGRIGWPESALTGLALLQASCLVLYLIPPTPSFHWGATFGHARSTSKIGKLRYDSAA
jgi:hypothetical protein